MTMLANVLAAYHNQKERNAPYCVRTHFTVQACHQYDKLLNVKIDSHILGALGAILGGTPVLEQIVQIHEIGQNSGAILEQQRELPYTARKTMNGFIRAMKIKSS